MAGLQFANKVKVTYTILPCSLRRYICNFDFVDIEKIPPTM